MAGILLCWLYVFFISIGVGALAYPYVFRRKSLFFLILSGLFFQMLLVHLWVLFFPVGVYFYILNLLIGGLGYLVNWETAKKISFLSVKSWKKNKGSVKTLSIATAILILLQSTTDTLIFDNDSYYIQSIKWLNEYGLVKGLANLHIYLGQMSGWHLLQSSLNFGFMGFNINCLNGFLMLIISFYSYSHLNDFLKKDAPKDLFIGLIPIGNLLFFQFISVPSPDLPVYLLMQILFYLFYDAWHSSGRGLRLISTVVLLAVLIKPTTLPLMILPVVLLIKRKFPRRDLKFIIRFAVISGVLFMLKNIFTSGMPLYPVKVFSGIYQPDWRISNEIFNYMFEKSRYVGMSDWEKVPPENLSEWEFLKNWLFGNNFRSFLNIFTVLGLIITPFFIRKNRALAWIYVCCLVQFIILYFTSPQTRFILPISFGMVLLVLVGVLKNHKKTAVVLIAFTSLIPIIFLLIPIKINLTGNGMIFKEFTPTFSLEYLIMPPPPSQSNYQYDKLQEGNLMYYSPHGADAKLHSVGDGKLPAANAVMIEYFKNKFKIRPQLRTKNMKDGFFAEQSSNILKEN